MQDTILYSPLKANNGAEFMLPIDKLTTPGEHTFIFTGAMGKLEAVLTVPEQLNTTVVAVLGHPHSLQGGTMNNKVVTTMARAFKESGIASLRFNFRGVGSSEGTYDAGIGEADDMLLLMQLWKERFPSSKFLIAGFSFGSYVAYRAAALSKAVLLITIAPPVHHYDYNEFLPLSSKWVIFQGNEDEVVPAQEVVDFALQNSLPVIPFAETGHFFHGKLLPLKSELIALIKQQVLEQ